MCLLCVTFIKTITNTHLKNAQDSEDSTSKKKSEEDNSAVTDKSASGWGAKKSFAAILKEKRAAASKEVSADFVFLFSLSYFFHQEKVFSNLRVAFLCNETCGLDTLYRASYFFRTTQESPDILKDQSISRTSNVLFESFLDCVDARSLRLISCLLFEDTMFFASSR